MGTKSFINNFVNILGNYSTTVPTQGNLYIEHNKVDSEGGLFIEREIYTNIVKYKTQHPRHSIFLTGNAGDGKTTICKGLVKKNIFRSEDVVEDFSALTKVERVDLLISIATKKNQKIIACNEGALRTSLNELINKYGTNSHLVTWAKWLKEQVVLDINSDVDSTYNVRVWNLNQENNSSDAIKLLEKMVDDKNWRICTNCPSFNKCPIKWNAQSLAATNVQESVSYLYDFVHDRGDHLTLRDLLIHLSFTITGGLHCIDVHKLNSKNKDDNDINLLLELRRTFSENFFGGNWKRQFRDKPLPVAFESLRQLSMGMHSNREIDHKLTLDSDELEKMDIFKFICSESSSTYLEDLLNKIQIGDQTITKKDADLFYDKILPVFRRLYYFLNGNKMSAITKASRYFEYEEFKSTLHSIEGDDVKKSKLAKKIILSLNRYQANSVSAQSETKLSIYSNSCLHSTLDLKLSLSMTELDQKRCRFSKPRDNRRILFYFNLPETKEIKLNIGLELYEYLMSIYKGINTPEMKKIFGAEIENFLSNLNSAIDKSYKGQFDWSLIDRNNIEILTFEDPRMINE